MLLTAKPSLQPPKLLYERRGLYLHTHTHTTIKTSINVIRCSNSDPKSKIFGVFWGGVFSDRIVICNSGFGLRLFSSLSLPGVQIIG